MTRPLIELERVSFAYESRFLEDRSATREWAVEDISLEVARGSHVAILGRNGSGKSTLARLIMGLERADAGRLSFAGLNPEREEDGWLIRRRCGLVFQNPDNQLVATTVEEDVAFGPENLGLPADEIRRRVDRALDLVGLGASAGRPPSELSGGQKQKLAIAGILAMEPECLILDEATSMLDPASRASFLALIRKLHEERGITVLNITHNMDEVLVAERVHVLHEGHILMSGTPSEIFRSPARIRASGLDVPAFAAISEGLFTRHNIAMPLAAAGSADQAERALRGSFQVRKVPRTSDPAAGEASCPADAETETVVRIEHLSYRYPRAGAASHPALEDISFTVRRGEFFGIMGQSGSGKSTLIQHLNGLLRPGSGRVTVLGHDLGRPADIRALRRRVQLLFQYPEHQLFAETVREDIAFGPTKLGVPADEISDRIAVAARITGLAPEWLGRSPFELSGGEKRRVALAGILAMQPELLILDEPAAGLDPAGRDEILSYLHELSRGEVTIILVSHSMEDLARLCDRVAVLHEGRLLAVDCVERVFADADLLAASEMTQPAVRAFLCRFSAELPGLDVNVRTPEAAVDALDRWLEPRVTAAGGAPRVLESGGAPRAHGSGGVR
ncbi:MAG: energy-coupling factor transporter ATPase [Bacillota bacterium]|nr:energy-coupling factor transporter ATPase [Bacillota bacterium]